MVKCGYMLHMQLLIAYQFYTLKYDYLDFCGKVPFGR